MRQPIYPARYQITLLPTLEVVAHFDTLPEAAAYMESYNQIMAGSGLRAAIAQPQRLTVQGLAADRRAAA